MKFITATLFAMILAFVAVSLFILVFTFPAMWLWNALIPNLFNGPILTFWQTFGLLILSRMFISSGSKINSK